MSRMTSSILRIQQSLDKVSGLDGDIAIQVEGVAIQVEAIVQFYIREHCHRCEYCSKTRDVSDKFNLEEVFCTEIHRFVSIQGLCSSFKLEEGTDGED